MGFRHDEEQARATSRWLLLLFALTVLFTVAAVNFALALAWRLQFWSIGYPTGFFETNTLVTLGFVLGGAWVESLQLRDGGSSVARLLGGREVVAPQAPGERRLRNVVDEMAIATGLKSPRVFVIDGEDAINALAAGWDQQDSVLAVTRGALERLSRDELQGVIAHEFAHILNGDTRLNMRLIGMVFGLQMVFNFGRSLMQPGERGRRGPAVLAGLALVAVGSIGWLAGRLLKAGVSRQREHLADAYAVQFTRLPSGIGNALRKIAAQLERGQRIAHVNAEVVSHLLLSSDTLVRGGWLATHPPIQERVRRIFGHDMPPLADDPVPAPQEAQGKPPPLPPLEFSIVPVLALQPAQQAPPFEWPDSTRPNELRAAVLAFLVPQQSESTAELAAWRQCAGPTDPSERMLDAVRSLPPRQRQPCFERLLGSAAALPRTDRARLLRDAVAVVRADGHLSLHEYLQVQVLHRQLSARPHAALERRRLALAALAGPITTMTWALASLLPEPQRMAWVQAVCTRLGFALPRQAPPVVISELNLAIEQTMLLGRVQRPALVKAWLEALPAPECTALLASVLRCLCLLIDTPLPPGLAARFDPLPALAEPARVPYGSP